MASGIYAIENTITGKFYVGSTKNFQQRWALHRGQLKRGEHHSVKLQRSYDKHGVDAFRYFVLKEVEDAALLPEVENEFIALYRAWEDGYNSAPSAHTFKPGKRSGRIALSKTKLSVRVDPDTPTTIRDMAASFGYVYGGEGATGELLDAIVSGKFILISKKKQPT